MIISRETQALMSKERGITEIKYQLINIYTQKIRNVIDLKM